MSLELVWAPGPFSGTHWGNIQDNTPIMANQMEKNMDNDTETVIITGTVRVIFGHFRLTHPDYASISMLRYGIET